ncbi:hypothetical protein BP6252_00140 [Coleophoma cylindrospora]|uniref:Ubiquitin-like protease family profile domain-containing protein n=1 Tax=Coleophoma cylindrospora TaxID=1849047 RepID=A0A3D8SQN5_9HELO|nr:hypothetical protein BP6252_00140 [Coleophoma cylindrospora]
MQTLRPREWLNDEIINAYSGLSFNSIDRNYNMKLVSTFFYPALRKAISVPDDIDYAAVQKWDLLRNNYDQDHIFIPLHTNQHHWSLAIISGVRAYVAAYPHGGKSCITITTLDSLASASAESQNQRIFLHFNMVLA